MVVRKVIRLAGMASVIAALPVLLHAGTLDLTWDASTGASGYRVYWGTASGQYGSTPKEVYSTGATVDTLADCTTYFFAVKAFNSVGESGFSTEVAAYPRPVLGASSPSVAIQGSQFTLDLTGTNFESGATVTINNANVFLDNPTRLACNHLQVAATVMPTAPGIRAAEIGWFTLTVTNPSGAALSKTQAFGVQVNPARFDLDKGYDCTTGWLDGWDTNALSMVFGSQAGDSVYRPDADIDGDGSVDGNDLAYVGSSFGKFWSGSAWVAKTPRPVCHF